jgi:hypothetical protein
MTEPVKCFDPRDKTQRLDDPTTWKPTDNPALILAHGLTNAEANWDWVVEQADYCDELVTNPYANAK